MNLTGDPSLLFPIGFCDRISDCLCYRNSKHAQLSERRAAWHGLSRNPSVPLVPPPWVVQFVPPPWALGGYVTYVALVRTAAALASERCLPCSPQAAMLPPTVASASTQFSLWRYFLRFTSIRFVQGVAVFRTAPRCADRPDFPPIPLLGAWTTSRETPISRAHQSCDPHGKPSTPDPCLWCSEKRSDLVLTSLRHSYGPRLSLHDNPCRPHPSSRILARASSALSSCDGGSFDQQTHACGSWLGPIGHATEAVVSSYVTAVRTSVWLPAGSDKRPLAFRETTLKNVNRILIRSAAMLIRQCVCTPRQAAHESSRHGQA